MSLDKIDNRYRELLDYLNGPKTASHTGDKTVCYLTFESSEIQYVKQKLNESWIEIAKHKNLQPLILSMHQVCKSFFEQDDFRLEAGADAVEYEDDMIEVFSDLGVNLKNNRIIENAILEAQEKLKAKGNGVLFITDLESIHPFIRFGPIEQKIYGDIEVPIVVFYPGMRSGYALKFLEFYPEDGNYRSKHF